MAKPSEFPEVDPDLVEDFIERLAEFFEMPARKRATGAIEGRVYDAQTGVVEPS